METKTKYWFDGKQLYRQHLSPILKGAINVTWPVPVIFENNTTTIIISLKRKIDGKDWTVRAHAKCKRSNTQSN
jgi:hypothetical protein